MNNLHREPQLPKPGSSGVSRIRRVGALLLACSLPLGVGACTPGSGGEVLPSSTIATTSTIPGPVVDPACNKSAGHLVGDSNAAKTGLTYKYLEEAMLAEGMPPGLNKAQPGSLIEDVENQLQALDDELKQKCGEGEYSKKAAVFSGSNNVSKAAFDLNTNPASTEQDLEELDNKSAELGYKIVFLFDPVKYSNIWYQSNFKNAKDVAGSLEAHPGGPNTKKVDVLPDLYEEGTPFGKPDNYLPGDDKHLDYKKIGGYIAGAIRRAFSFYTGDRKVTVTIPK
jgi:hypothetical protein